MVVMFVSVVVVVLFMFLVVMVVVIFLNLILFQMLAPAGRSINRFKIKRVGCKNFFNINLAVVGFDYLYSRMQGFDNFPYFFKLVFSYQILFVYYKG